MHVSIPQVQPAGFFIIPERAEFKRAGNAFGAAAGHPGKASHISGHIYENNKKKQEKVL
ncbi:MAG: hypothetical protein HUJ75_08280 [Parasporobacterium sp.]|nr:hypothetical protein [Parasporobacterium sp.]